MSTEATADAATEVEAHDEDHEHPSDKKYIQIAIILAILTAIEVMTYVIDIGDALVPVIYFIMAVKFYLVAGFFMHLKFDSPMFTKLFVTGLVGATVVYVIMLSAFQIWDEF